MCVCARDVLIIFWNRISVVTCQSSAWVAEAVLTRSSHRSVVVRIMFHLSRDFFAALCIFIFKIMIIVIVIVGK